MSLRGKDVNDRDPAPPPPKRKAEDGENKEGDGASDTKKRKVIDDAGLF